MRRFIYIDGGMKSAPPTPSLYQTAYLNIGDLKNNTPQVNGWWRWCYNNTNPLTGITNSNDENTGWGISVNTVPLGSSSGIIVSNDAGIPSGVTKYEQRNTTDVIYTIGQLNDTYTYNFSFWCSITLSYEGGGTSFTIGGTTVSINPHKNYTGDWVTISNVKSSSNDISFTLSKMTGASYWYLAAVKIEEYR